MRISNNYTLRIHNADNWWGHSYFYSYHGNTYTKRAARGLRDSILSEIKRK